MIKKIIPVFIFVFLVHYSFGQEVATLLKLHDLSVALGVSNNISIDTFTIKSRPGKINIRISEQQMFLLRASESYSAKDYENSSFYARKVVLLFENNDLNNLRYVIMVGSLANLKDARETARFFYIANKIKRIDPESLKIIRREIRNNFTRDIFEKALSTFYYYHDRLRMLDEIKFEK